MLHRLARGIHPTVITEAFQAASMKADDVLQSMAVPVELTDKQALTDAAVTSLSSKVCLH